MFPAQQHRRPRPTQIVARETRPTVLDVRDLVKHYPLLKGGLLRRRVGTVHAVDGISFDIRERETLGLVGESGCGKTTAIMEILNLVKPQAGTIVVLGRDTATLTRRRAIRHPPRPAGGVSGSAGVARPAPADWRHPRRAAPDARRAARRSRAGACASC